MTLLQPGWTSGTRQVNGVSLHVVEAGPADGPLLILLHGFPEFWWAWRHQITPLAEAGYHVVVPDMRGYNTSDAPPDIAAYHLDVLVADVLALADGFGARRFRLVGHDWGAIVAWATGASHPERLQRLVVMDGPHPDLWGRQAARHPTQALRSTYVALFQLPWLPETVLGGLDFAGLRTMMQGSANADAFEPGAVERYAEAWAHPGSLTAMLNYYRALRLRTTPPTPRRISPRTLIVWGENDVFLERHVAEAGLALCDKGQLYIVGGATHWLHLEKPDQVTGVLTRFLGGEEDDAPTPGKGQEAMGDGTNERLGRDYMAAFRDSDEAWWDAHIAPEFVRHDPGLPFEVRGPEGIRKLGAFFHGAFSEVELPVTHVVVQGDKVLVHLRMQGRHTGEFNGTPPTGNRIDAEVMDLFRVEGDKLVEHWALMDNLSMLKQIGAVKA